MSKTLGDKTYEIVQSVRDYPIPTREYLLTSALQAVLGLTCTDILLVRKSGELIPLSTIAAEASKRWD